MTLLVELLIDDHKNAVDTSSCQTQVKTSIFQPLQFSVHCSCRAKTHVAPGEKMRSLLRANHHCVIAKALDDDDKE